MTLFDRILSPVRDAGMVTRDRATLAAHGTHGGPGWVGSALLSLGAAAAGAGAAFLLDPARGRSRRARLADQSAATLRRFGRRAEHIASRVRSDVSGRVAALRASGDEMPHSTDDATVTDRVRSEVFRGRAVPKGDVNINVERGVVVLRGEVRDDAARRKLVERVEHVEGVWSVRDLLHLPGEPAPSVEDAVAARS